MMKRTPEELAAFDSGYGRRGISHHRDNPYAATDPLHAHYEAGFAAMDAEANAFGQGTEHDQG